jgi:1-acyl-sn-glycerol-3-phosphate acyltransferase
MGSALARTIISVWSWIVFGLLLIIWVPLVGLVRLVTAPFDKGRYAAGYLFRKLAVIHQVLNPLWHFEVVGQPPANPRRPYVVVANHESFVDILLISHLPFEMKWLSKAEFFKIPLVGWLMRLAGDIPLDRSSGKSAVEALKKCRVRLDERVSVMIFPEGTRSESGELQEFKDGAFRLAIDAGVPIIPLAVHGTKTALRKHDWRFGHARAEVRILDPVSTEGLTKVDAPALRDQVRGRIDAELQTMRAADASR